MKIKASYELKTNSEPDRILRITDGNPEGVIIIIEDIKLDKSISFNIPRFEMMEFLDYIRERILPTDDRYRNDNYVRVRDENGMPF